MFWDYLDNQLWQLALVMLQGGIVTGVTVMPLTAHLLL